MDVEAAERFCERWLAAWTGGAARVDELLAFYSPDAFYADPAQPGGLRGSDELRLYLRKLLERYPSWSWEALEIFSTPKGFYLEVAGHAGPATGPRPGHRRDGGRADHPERGLLRPARGLRVSGITLHIACRCGAVAIVISASPIVQMYCHCDDCQAVHGGAYVPESVYRADAVKVVRGEPLTWKLRRSPRFTCWHVRHAPFYRGASAWTARRQRLPPSSRRVPPGGSEELEHHLCGREVAKEGSRPCRSWRRRNVKQHLVS